MTLGELVWAAWGGTPQDGLVLLQIDVFARSPAVPDAAIPPAQLHLSDAVRAASQEEAVTYTCVLPVSRTAVAFVADLLAAHQRQLRTRMGRRALSCWDQAVAFWRWMLDGVEAERLAADCGIARSTAHRDVTEALGVVAARAPSLHGALLAARAAGHAHVNLVPHFVGGAPRHTGAHRPGLDPRADHRPDEEEQRTTAHES